MFHDSLKLIWTKDTLMPSVNGAWWYPFSLGHSTKPQSGGANDHIWEDNVWKFKRTEMYDVYIFVVSYLNKK